MCFQKRRQCRDWNTCFPIFAHAPPLGFVADVFAAENFLGCYAAESQACVEGASLGPLLHEVLPARAGSTQVCLCFTVEGFQREPWIEGTHFLNLHCMWMSALEIIQSSLTFFTLSKGAAANTSTVCRAQKGGLEESYQKYYLQV